MRNLWLLEESGITEDIVSAEKQDNVNADLEDGLMVLYVNGALSMREYKQLQEYANFARDKKEVKAVGMVIDSPGGLVNGLAETCKEIQNIGKPVFAFTETMAASAAYAIASCADKIYASQSGEIGSVGARVLHVDYSKMLNDAGIKITEVGFGKKKTQFSPFHSLSEDDKNDLSEYVKEAYDGFVKHVKTRRENIDKEVFDSGLYNGVKAKKVGLIDGGISTERRFINFMKKDIDSKSKLPNNRIMSNNSIHTEIDEANEHIEKLESSQGGILAWLKNRFGEKPQSSDVKSEYDDKDKEKKDDDDDDKKKEQARDIEKLGAAFTELSDGLQEARTSIANLEAKIAVLTDRLGGDSSPSANVNGIQGGDNEQLDHHRAVQKTLETHKERQDYGAKYIAPLQKKLGRLT